MRGTRLGCEAVLIAAGLLNPGRSVYLKTSAKPGADTGRASPARCLRASYRLIEITAGCAPTVAMS